MQILVVSDSHGDFNTLNKLIRTKPKAEVVIFCGDGQSRGRLDGIKGDHSDKRTIHL